MFEKEWTVTDRPLNCLFMASRIKKKLFFKHWHDIFFFLQSDFILSVEIVDDHKMLFSHTPTIRVFFFVCFLSFSRNKKILISQIGKKKFLKY